jgi:hypothetical protein
VTKINYTHDEYKNYHGLVIEDEEADTIYFRLMAIYNQGNTETEAAYRCFRTTGKTLIHYETVRKKKFFGPPNYILRCSLEGPMDIIPFLVLASKTSRVPINQQESGKQHPLQGQKSKAYDYSLPSDFVEEGHYFRVFFEYSLDADDYTLCPIKEDQKF